MKLTGKSLLLLLTWGVAVLSAESAWAQDLQHLQVCNNLLGDELLALVDAQAAENRGESAVGRWEQLVAKARANLTFCRDLMDRRSEAVTLNHIGVGLHNLGKYQDAVPVLRRCISVGPDAASCWTNMGLSLMELNKREEAKDSFTRAIAIGGYDIVNAKAIELAKQQLAALQGVPPPSGVAPSPVGTFIAEKQFVLAKVADPRKAWLLRCFRESRRCEQIEASVLDVGLVDIWPFEFAILRWDANGLVAQDDSATCVTVRLVVNFADKSVTLFTSPKKLEVETPVCRAARSETVELMRKGEAK